MPSIRSNAATQGSNSQVYRVEHYMLSEQRTQTYVEDTTYSANGRASGVEGATRARTEEEMRREYGALFASVEHMTRQQSISNQQLLRDLRTLRRRPHMSTS
ncbi:hypothetical protein NPX13_g4734 [Xylaria arbuscula]|uniref:Uncharacterized protein n=1 Tax=Xylaria arbuscula TaxID=114810 RepID=A0A9W8NFB0_9PEZI|nr:hypothetical protein NPX13_g4734 [Xylaria arbuscula]